MPQPISTLSGIPEAFHRWFLYLTVFMTGAAIMVIELLGTRIVAPFYGNSLYVWSSLISITMIALAIGYFLGGYCSDNKPDTRLSLIIGIAALCTLIIPWAARPVLLLSDPLGLRAGAFFSALVLFTPSLTALGMITPLAIKRSTMTLNDLGNCVGSIYAVSTIGSVIGTLLLGFFLFPILGSREILIGLGIGLMTLSGITFFFENKRLQMNSGLWSMLILFTLILMALPQAISAGKFESPDQTFNLRWEQESLYGWVRVIDQPARDLRILTSDSSSIGAASLSNGQSRLSYQDIVGLIPVIQPSMKKALIIGLGAGHMANVLHDYYGMLVDTLEIDPAVATAAVDFFGHHPSGRSIVGDARYEIQHLTGPYDLIIHDCFTGGSEPAHLLTVETLTRLRQLMSPQGIMALNFVGFADGPNSTALASVAKTIAQVFPQQKTFISEPGKQFNDFIFLAGQHLTDTDFNQLNTQQLAWLKSREVTVNTDKGVVLNDNLNPLEHLQIAKAERYRRFIVEWLGPHLLLR